MGLILNLPEVLTWGTGTLFLIFNARATVQYTISSAGGVYAERLWVLKRLRTRALSFSAVC